MNLYQAQLILEKLTDRYLFANKFAYAGFDDEYEIEDERIIKLFRSIEAIGIGKNIKNEFFLKFYYSKAIKNQHLIAQEFNISTNETIFCFNKPFELQS